jgi:hypothetical protein
VVIDIDATLISAHGEKRGAAATYKRAVAFLRCWPGWTAPEAVAAILPPGNGTDTAADHIEPNEGLFAVTMAASRYRSGVG